MTTFDHDDQTKRPLPVDGQAAARRRAHAAEVMADLAGATQAAIDTLPAELPVEALVACGGCRLYGGVSPGIEFPVWLAAIAADRIAGLLDSATDEANRLPGALAGLLPEESEDLLASLVHARMDSWAGMIQLDDVAEHAAGDPAAATLEAAIDRFAGSLDRFDRAIFARQEELGQLTATRLLTNLRGMLAPEYRDPLPWWLDGRIEDDAIDSLVEKTLLAPPRAQTSPAALDVARLRAAWEPSYAAAASTAAAGAGEAGTRPLRWKSPDGGFVARLVPPAERQAVPTQISITFRTTAGGPALSLEGRPCSLAGVRGVIGRRTVAGEDAVLVEFSGRLILPALSNLTATDALAFTVGDSDTVWNLEP
jgi:hypothetical protein